MGTQDMQQHRPHKKARLGAGVSIEKFAKAKVSTYDKHAVKDKERALNAKKVNKYRKLKERLKDKLQPAVRIVEDLDEDAQPAAPQQHTSAANPPEPHEAVAGDTGAGAGARARAAPQQLHRGGRPQERGVQGGAGQQQQQGGKEKKQHKPLSQLQRLAADVQEKKAAEQREREERARAAAERKARLDADAKRRAAQSKQYRKKTHGGQPLMKVRIEKMLGKLGAV